MTRRSLIDLPPPVVPSDPQEEGAPRVVTIGGGHGQAALLSALVGLEASITAVVSIADDGGCSGKLREELGMPPPGDIRRCLVSLSTRPELARRFEERLSGEEEGRCVGNLVIAEMYRHLESLQLAVDWAASLLGCRGRVVPAADSPGVLRVYDLEWGAMSGESAIEAKSASPMVVNVEGPDKASAEAKAAIASADLVFLGPGSFVGSTLAALTTGDLAEAVALARGRRVLVKNIEREASSSYGLDDHERVLVDHLVIKSGGENVTLDVLSHTQRGHRKDLRADASVHFAAPLVRPGSRTHDADLVAEALVTHFGLQRAAPRSTHEPNPEASAFFDDALERARRRLHG